MDNKIKNTENASSVYNESFKNKNLLDSYINITDQSQN